ncbi:MAG: hypothetical protein IPH13_08540 [Planctomycetes bacterium]|nr:hypothetical protein [Planctomycetota bacterium]MCC7171065.1 hypothetical protein [Planctomycetota bacterium]
MKRLISSLAVVALAATGCQHSYKFQSSPEFQQYSEEVNQWTGTEKVGIYLKDRFLDLADIVQADLSVGDGFLVNAHATKWLQAGGGYMNHGLRWGLLKRSAGTWSDDRVEGGVAAGFNLYWVDIKRLPVWGTSTLFQNEFAYEGPDYLNNHDRHWSDLGGNLHFAFIGANLNASPYEAVDFLLGILAIPTIYAGPLSPEMDLGDDDTRAILREKYCLPHYEYTLEHWDAWHR